MNDGGSTGSAAQWVSAAVTFLAVAAALFKEDIVKHWRRPRLVAKLKLEPPDCHKVPATLVNQETHRTIGTIDAYYFRIWIENTGSVRAENAQVFAAELRRKNVAGSFQREGSFLPMNLKWAHTGKVFADGIAPRMGMHCDLGHIFDPARLQALRPGGDGLARFILDTEVVPNSLSNEIAPGVYQLDLRIAASNAPPLEISYEINFTGKWFAEEREMLLDGVGIIES